MNHKILIIVGLLFFSPLFAIKEIIPFKIDKESHDAIYQAAKPPSKGGIIILPDADGGRDHPLLKILARQLAQSHWDTLLLDWPAIDFSADAKTFNKQQDLLMPTIQDALTQLEKKSNKKTNIIIGYGSGSLFLLNQMKKKPLNIKAMILISLQSPITPEKISLDFKMPLLDLVAEQDYVATLKFFIQRQEQIEKNHPSYQSKIITGADHDYAKQESAVVNKIKNWLEKK